MFRSESAKQTADLSYRREPVATDKQNPKPVHRRQKISAACKTGFSVYREIATGSRL